MQASIIQSTHIRPLGEEHLRMFKRHVGTQEETPPKVTMSKEAVEKVFLSSEKLKFFELEKAPEIVKKLGGRLATINEIIFREHSIQVVSESWSVWIDWKDMPTKEGWYLIDKKHEQLTPLDEKQADELRNHNTLHISQSAITAAEGKFPIALILMYDKGEKSCSAQLSGVERDPDDKGAVLALIK